MADVRDVFASVERTCPSCGATSRTSGRSCPVCGATYIARRVKPLGTRRRKKIFAAVVLALLLIGGGAVALLAPGINRAKHAYSSAQARVDAATMASLVAKARADQRLHSAMSSAHDPGSAVPSARRLKLRASVVVALQLAVAADVHARVRAGTLTGPVRYVSCSPYPPGTASAALALSERFGSYACLSVNGVAVRGADQHEVVLGDPFWGRVDFATGRMAWCKVNPRPGEGGAGTGPPPVPLAQACDLEQAPPASF